MKSYFSGHQLADTINAKFAEISSHENRQKLVDLIDYETLSLIHDLKSRRLSNASSTVTSPKQARRSVS